MIAAVVSERHWEHEMQDNGAARFREQQARLVAQGHEDRTPSGRRTIKTSVGPLAEEILTRSAGQQERGPGRPKAESADLKECFNTEFLRLLARPSDGDDPARGAEVLAYLTICRTLQRRSSDSLTRITLALQIGEDVEREARAILRQEAQAEPRWSKDKRLRIGAELFDLFEETCNVVETVSDMEDGKTQIYVSMTPSAAGFMKMFDAEHEGLSPQLLPTIVPPKDWDAEGRGGGYHFLPPLPLVASHPDPTIKSRVVGEQMARAVNILQKTAWTVNRNVLRVMQQIWYAGEGVGKLPAPATPPSYFPLSFSEAKKRAKAAGASKAEVGALWDEHRGYQKHEGRCNVAHLTIKASVKCLPFERIYFPYQLDFRGRFNAVPEIFQYPQGQDYTRALLMFADGQPLKTSKDVGWLAVHGANLYGYDKMSFEDRTSFLNPFVEEEILKSARDPLGHRWWTEADDPWQFLAFCFEWRDLVEYQAVHEGRYEGFVSRLPIALDCTCNGIQHYAAMLRDQKTGEAVNLTLPKMQGEQVVSWISVDDDAREEEITSIETIDDDKGRPIPGSEHEVRETVTIAKEDSGPRDIYADIARAVKGHVLGQNGAWPDPSIEHLLIKSDDKTLRRMMKPNVMHWGYGAGDSDRWDTLREFLTNKEESRTPSPLWSGDIPFEAIRRGAEIIEEKLDDAAPAVKDAMEWLRGLAKLMGKAPIKWRTPAGFEVTHYYPELVTRDIKTTRHTHTIRTGEVNREKVRGKQKTAMAPNFVHSLDAAALAETVTLASSKYGITSFSVVHDSYATTAAQTEDLRKAIADRFKWLYTEHTPLEDLRARVVEALPGVEVPGVPSGDGKLDLSRLSPYFCS